MRRIRMAALLTAPVLMGALVTLGCSSGNKDNQQGEATPAPESRGGGRAESGSRGTKTEVASTGWGTLKGKVTLEGTPPQPVKLDINKDKEYCEKGDTKEQTWKIGGSDQGVGDVVVWLRAPKNHYFKIPDDKKKVDHKVTLDQPYCTFIPHVLALYPTYYDPEAKKQVATGEILEIANSASITHNTNYSAAPGSDTTVVPSGNPMLAQKTHKDEPNVRANKGDRVGGEQLMVFKCNIHNWMKAYGWIFDHPYFAVTAGDQAGQDFGAYKIDKVPTGAPVDIVYWHESMDKPMVFKENFTLKDGDNTIDIKLHK